jgi:ABC-type ATPase with predicted acetyltransferase domain
MIRVRETVASPAFDSYRANRVRSLFNVEKLQGSTHSIAVDLPIDERPWRIGLVVGPSGSGKTTLGRKILGDDALHKGFDWRPDAPIVDEIGRDAEFNDVTGALSSVGLGTVPSWLRPFHVLSNGEKVRAELARILVERPARVVVDEFTSVVDRQIAQVGAAAFAKAWRRNDAGQAVLLSCHYDIVEWLQPDWLLDTREWQFGWRSVQRPPRIDVDVFRTNWSAWRFFEAHHYLKLPRMVSAFPYVATVRDEPVAFCAVATQVGLKSSRISRLVVMPEWQGAGVGLRFLCAVAEDWLRGRNRYGLRLQSSITTSHPGLVAALSRHRAWRLASERLLGESGNKTQPDRGRYGGHLRATASFRYVGEAA